MFLIYSKVTHPYPYNVRMGAQIIATVNLVCLGRL